MKKNVVVVTFETPDLASKALDYLKENRKGTGYKVIEADLVNNDADAIDLAEGFTDEAVFADEADDCLLYTSSGSGLARPMVGGIMPSCRAKAQTMASMAPVAPNMWPVMLLVELMRAARAASSPRAILKPAVSQASLSLVEVPWALM